LATEPAPNHKIWPSTKKMAGWVGFVGLAAHELINAHKSPFFIENYACIYTCIGKVMHIKAL